LKFVALYIADCSKYGSIRTKTPKFSLKPPGLFGGL